MLRKILLTQPNYGRFGKKTFYELCPYSLGIINACISDSYDTILLDPTHEMMSDKEIEGFLNKKNPEVVGIGSVSTEYIQEVEHMTNLVRKTLPNAIIIEGGILPTIAIDIAMRDKNVDYWIIGEGERNFTQLLNEFNKAKPDLSTIRGLAYYKDDKPIITMSDGFIQDLDSIPFPDYGNLNIMKYANTIHKYTAWAKAYPNISTITSRGCPFRCCFCSGSLVSGKKVRMRSAENVLQEIDELYYKYGIKEVIFLDDHFFFDRNRAIDIMNGLIERNYGILWKCANLTIWLLDEELIDLMSKSGSYHMTVSLESGNQDVLTNIVKKPINLKKAVKLIELIKRKGFEIVVNFIIGFPHETWDQIRETFDFAEKIDVDLVNFHLATPLPKTELMDICVKEGYLPKDYCGVVGYTKGCISTDEFTGQELQFLRAYEWDRINFKTEDKRKKIAKIVSLNLDELDKWRKDTRRKLGVSVIK